MSRLERLIAAIEKTEAILSRTQTRLRRLRHEARLEMRIRSEPKTILSLRQAQVAEMVRDHSNKEIAAALSITVRTVKFHVANLLHKFEVQSRNELPF